MFKSTHPHKIADGSQLCQKVPEKSSICCCATIWRCAPILSIRFLVPKPWLFDEHLNLQNEDLS